MKLTVPAALSGERVDRIVALVTGLPRAEAAALISSGAVSLAGRPLTARSRRLAEGDELDLRLGPSRAGALPTADPSVEVKVCFADRWVIVVDKPAGLVVHPGSGTPRGTLVNGLLARFPALADQPWPDPARPGIVHRLDKGTSGLLMVAGTVDALVSLSAQLQARTVERRYVALVWGRVEAEAGVIEAPLGRSAGDPLRMAVRADGRPAVTHYAVIRRFDHPVPATLLSCRLETGRTHQIRVHLAAIGHPVVGDDRYARPGSSGRQRRRPPAVDASLDPGRPFLHAASLAFDHPATGERCSFASDLPADLEAVLGRLS